MHEQPIFDAGDNKGSSFGINAIHRRIWNRLEVSSLSVSQRFACAGARVVAESRKRGPIQGLFCDGTYDFRLSGGMVSALHAGSEALYNSEVLSLPSPWTADSALQCDTSES